MAGDVVRRVLVVELDKWMVNGRLTRQVYVYVYVWMYIRFLLKFPRSCSSSCGRL